MKFAEGDGRFYILEHSSSILDKKLDRHSTGSLKKIHKYQVNPLGNYVEIKDEQRQGTIKENWEQKLQKRKKLRLDKKKVKEQK